MDFKNIKLNRNTVLIAAAVVALIIVSVVPGVLTESLKNLAYVSSVAFFISGAIWFWRHMK